MKKVIIWLVSLLMLISLSSITFAQGGSDQNLLVNGGFEAAGQDQKPDNWRADFWQPESTFTVTTKKAHQGKYALLITSDKVANDARMIQTVQVKPNTYYKLSGWVATENVTPQKIGANLCVMTNTFTNSSSLNDTIDWTYMEYNFRTSAKQTEVNVGARLGMWGNDVKGAAYFDDLSLVELNKAPANAQVLQEPAAATSSATTTPAKKTFPKAGLIVILILIGLVLIFVLYKRRQKRDKQVANDIQDVQDTQDINEVQDAQGVQDIEGEGVDDGNEDKER